MNKYINSIFLLLGVIPKLGVFNVLYVVGYKLILKTGLLKYKFKPESVVRGPYFNSISKVKKVPNYMVDNSIDEANNIMNGIFTYYHHHNFYLSETPDWFYDPFSKMKLSDDIIEKHWVDIQEFNLNTGDIKNLWELSRFDWVISLSKGYAVTGEIKYLHRLNALLENWCVSNPLNIGVNWRCGQEVGIRVMRLFNACVVMGGGKDLNRNLIELVFVHLERIHGNIKYAISQNNNHSITEASSLYIGACWLLAQKSLPKSVKSSSLEKFKKKGRLVLEKGIKNLILVDGTFSQKSTNYHRVVVDAFSFTLFGMRAFSEPGFSARDVGKLKELGFWLFNMISNEKGNVPLFGANDGSMLETLHSCAYIDYRPSIQLLYGLLNKTLLWKDPLVIEVFIWRSINVNTLKLVESTELKSKIFDKEFVQMAYKNIIVRIKSNQNNFRPHNDVLNIDVWFNGENIITDSGSYSYKIEKENSFFRSIKAHNSLQFGAFEPMPRISRFLNGKWVKVVGSDLSEDDKQIIWSGGYVDYRGNRHKRTVILNKIDSVIKIIDGFSGNEIENKMLRFNIPPNIGYLIDTFCTDCKGNIIKSNLDSGWRSLYYMEKEKVNTILYESTEQSGEFHTFIYLGGIAE